MLPATIVMNTRRPIIGRSRRLALAGVRLFTPSPSQKAGGWRRQCLWGARVELTAAPKLCRQSAVVGECRVDVHHKVAGLISHQRSYAAASLALHDQASAAEHDLAPSARLTDRLAGHEVVRAVLSDRQLDVPATDLTSDTTTGAIGPTPARPGSEATNPITTARVIMAQSERVPLDIIASLLLLLAKKAVQLSRGSTVVQRRRWPRERRPRPR